ncbi:CATRA system-associated protein [Streptomyces sp. NPDC056269]|uniref:CATRA system-associated protein n=1 Tax=Streptomyces sp. NPDC056269 TaxID=3345768 RepID=UPI0035E12CC1
MSPTETGDTVPNPDQHPEQFPQRYSNPTADHHPPAEPGPNPAPDRVPYPRQVPSPVAAVLSGTLGWRLSPEGWEAVGQALDELAAAGGSPDTPAGQRAFAALLAAGPGRVLRAGAGAAAPGLPAPPRIRERVNHLVHQLTTPAPHSTATSGAEARPASGSRPEEGTDG